MARCEVCGNEYHKSFELIMNEKSHIFDCFECAIHALAPPASTATVELSDMGVKPETFSIAVPIARLRKGSSDFKITLDWDSIQRGP